MSGDRQLPVLNSAGQVLLVADETAARELLKRKKATPIWGKRGIISLLAISGPEPTEVWDSPRDESEVSGCPDLFSARWESIFRDPMRPNVWIGDPLLDVLFAERQRELEAIRPRPAKRSRGEMSSQLPLAA